MNSKHLKLKQKLCLNIGELQIKSTSENAQGSLSKNLNLFSKSLCTNKSINGYWYNDNYFQMLTFILALIYTTLTDIHEHI